MIDASLEKHRRTLTDLGAHPVKEDDDYWIDLVLKRSANIVH